jgi:hypothetical protein
MFSDLPLIAAGSVETVPTADAMAVWPVLLSGLVMGGLLVIIGVGLVRGDWFRKALGATIALLVAVAVALFVIRLYFSRSVDEPATVVYPHELQPGLSQSDDSTGQDRDSRVVENVPVVSNGTARMVPSEPSPATPAAAASKLPVWVQAPEADTGGPLRRVVSSQRFATVDEAWQDALTQASQVITDHLFRDDPIHSAWTVPKDWIRAFAVREHFEETVQQNLGPVSASMYRVHLLLDLSGATGEKLAQLKKDALVTERLWLLGGGTGLLTLLFSTIAGYLRLDAATHGAYRGRLKLAAASILGAAGAVVVFLA